jgi:hypothetical protein
LLIIGGAPGAMDDLGRIRDLILFDLMLVGWGNAETRIISDLSFHVSHENDFESVMLGRRDANVNLDYETVSNNPWPLVSHVFPEMTGPTCPFDCNPRLPSNDRRALHHFSGSSAMLALKVGLRFGYRKIVLAGISLDAGRYEAFQRGWTWIADILKYCPARALSGFPATILGEYSDEWFNDEGRYVQ